MPSINSNSIIVTLDPFSPSSESAWCVCGVCVWVGVWVWNKIINTEIVQLLLIKTRVLRLELTLRLGLKVS